MGEDAPVKRIVYPKMKILSSYSPSSCSKPFFCWTQKKIIFWRMWTKQLTRLTSIKKRKEIVCYLW